jgi:hypothetical protein
VLKKLHNLEENETEVKNFDFEDGEFRFANNKKEKNEDISEFSLFAKNEKFKLRSNLKIHLQY